MSSIMAKAGARVMSLGKQSAELHVATKRDIGKILQLCYAEGWIDYTYEELEYLLEASPNSCFKLTADGELIGVNFATVVGNGICYPHSNLIASEYRSKVNYFDEAVKYNEFLKTLSRLDILYAARKVIRLYQSGGGFTPLGYYRRASINTRTIRLDGNPAREAVEADLPAIHALCHDIYHAGREDLIRYFVGRGIARAYVLPSAGGGISAFAMVRKLPKYHLIGPVLASNEADAAAVAAAAACGQPDAIVMVDGEEDKLSRLLQNHFSYQWEENVALKMYRGDKSLLEDESRIYSIFARYTS